MLYTDHWHFTEDIKLIWTDLKHMGWANICTLSASITFVRIDDDEPVARTVLRTIIGYH